MKMKLALALLFVLSLLSVSVLADETSNYQIENIYLYGINTDDGTIYVERGDSLDLSVYLSGTGETTDINVKAWIGGYEYDSVEATSEMFDIEDGVNYRIKLSLPVPEDMNAEQDYTLYVEVYDDVDYTRETATIRVSKDRHLLSIQDILIDNVDAGDYTTATVRLENMGDKKEEDIKVTVSIPELGIEKSTFLDELTNNEINNEDEESSGDVDLNLEIPETAETGSYEVLVTVSYNKGYDTLEDSTSIYVEAQEKETAEDDSTVTVVVDNTDDSEESDNTDFSTALKLGFGILAVLIVILALILIVRR